MIVANITPSNETRPSVNPLPKLSAYIRHKSESYISRRRSEDYRYHRPTNRLHALTRDNTNLSNTTLSSDDRHLSSGQFQENTSEQELVKSEGELL